MSTATNSLINGNGLVAYNNTTGVFSETAMVQYSTLVGGANAQSIVQVAPNAVAGHALVSNGSAANPSYSTTIIVAGGGTGATTLTGLVTGNGTSAMTASAISQHDVLIGGASNAVVSVSPSTAGFVLTSNGTGSDPSFQAAPASLTWVDVTSGTQTIAAGTGYVTDNATQVTYTLPASPAFGDVFEITGGASGSATAPWLVATNAGQSINFRNTTATTSVASTLQYDSIRCVCIVAGASGVFNILSSVGNLILT